MNKSILQKKQRLIDWLLALDNPNTIIKLDDFKNELESQHYINEPQTAFAVTDDFEEKFTKGFTIKESRARTIHFIEELPWKK